MAINLDDSFEVNENGIAIIDDNGDTVGYFTAGTGDPSGSPAPVNTWYFSQDTQLMYYKFGTGNSDWRQVRASDMTFDPTGLLNMDPSDTDVQAAIARLGNQSLGDLTEAEGFTSLAKETTTSNGWVSKSGSPFVTINTKTAGIFSIRWSANVGQTKNGRNFGFRVRWRPTGGTYVVLSEVQMSISDDNSVLMQGGFQEVTLPSDNTIEVDVQHGQTVNGSSSIIEAVSVEVRRLGDS